MPDWFGKFKIGVGLEKHHLGPIVCLKKVTGRKLAMGDKSTLIKILG